MAQTIAGISSMATRRVLAELVGRYGRVRLLRVDGALRLVTNDKALLEELSN